MIDQLFSVNALLIMLGAGLLVWIARQLIPDTVEEHRVWKVALRLLPIILGGLLALIPDLRPMENVTQSVTLGAIAGSFSSAAYGIARQAFGERVRLLLGSKSNRKAQSEQESDV